MRLKEFIKEAGRNGSSEFDADPNAKPAETPDWLKKVGKYLGDKIGLKEPVALPDYTASTQQDAAAKSNYRGIDPVIRKSLGMAPATQQEIDAYMKANPAVVGNLVGRDGKPIASGGALDTERAARAAAPRRGADFDVDSYAGAPDPAAVGNRFYTPRELGFQPGGTMPAEKKAAAVPPADSRISKLPPAAVPPASAPPPPPPAAAPVVVTSPVPAPVAEKPVALAPAEPAALAPAAAAEPAALAPAAAAEPAALAPAAAAAPAAAGAAAKELDARELERLTRLAGVSAGAPASGGSPTAFVRDKSGDKFDPQEKKKPIDTKSLVNGGINIRPTVWAYAINMGLIQNGKLDIERIKKFQRSQGIKDDGIIGKDTSNAILSVGNAYRGAGTGRGDSGNPGGTPINVDEPKQIGYVEPLPGVKDSKGRQVWRKNDGVLAGFDPDEHRMYRIGNLLKLMRDPNAGAETGNGKLQPIGKTHEGLTIYRYANGRFGAWDADNRKMIPIDAPASQATVAKESSDMQRMRLLAGLTGK